MNKVTLEEYITQLPTILNKYPQIAGVFLFGSFNTPFFTEHSDLDLGVVYSQPVELFTELQIEADISQLLKTDSIDWVNLNKAPLILKYNAIAKGRLIFEKDYVAVSDFMERVFSSYCDFEYDYRILCAEYDQSLRETYHG